MTAALIYRQQPIRILIVIGLVFLIGLKVTAPVFRISKLFVKGVSLAPESDTDKTEKEENSDYNKNKEYYGNCTATIYHLSWYTEIAHFSKYVIDYQSSHFYQITTPPPDFYLHATV